MTAKNDILNAEILEKKLGDDIEVIYYPSIDSTNTQTKRLIGKGKRNTFLVVSEEQTNGRGRQGKSFYSPAKTGIYMSFVFHPMADFSGVVSCTTAASVAVCKAIESLCDKRPEIKWVNDIYLGGKKICGILCEAVNGAETGRVASVIIGIGLNLKTTEFPDYVENAHCLDAEIERADMISEITKELINIVSCDYGDFIDYYRAHSMIIGRDIDFIENGEKTHAKALEIDGEGGLRVLLDNGEIKTLKSGEISIRRRN